jgi:RNA polymerase sigma-70 factor (ECF subfamily)
MALAARIPMSGLDDPTPRPETESGVDLRVPELTALYEGHVDFVWRTLRRYGVPDCSLEDAVQDVFVVAYDKLGRFEGRSSLKTWIFGIARRIARDHRRGGRASSLASDHLEALVDTAGSGAASFEQLELARMLEHALSGIDPDKREAFILVDIEELTIAEAARALGANPNTVYSRLRAARAEIERVVARSRADRPGRQA